MLTAPLRPSASVPHRELLEAKRQQLGWSVARLADEAGYHPNTVLRVLHGQNVYVRTFEDVAITLGFAVRLTNGRV